MSEKIQLFSPYFRTEECLEEIRECLDIGWTGLGFKTVEFEKKWNEYTGHKNSHFLNSATVGLNLAVEILKEQYKWEDDSEIVTTPLTFVSTNHAILLNHLQPVFADVDEFLCLDPLSVEKNITKKTKAILYVGLGGNTGRFAKIVSLCKKYDLKLILDAAHMAGTWFHGKAPGLLSDVAIYSFQAVKNLPTGDSGMISFSDSDLDMIARKKSWLGINKDTFARTSAQGAYKWKYDVEYVGHKDHGNSIMAAIGLVQLRYLEQDNAYRKQICNWYDSGFSGTNQVTPIHVAPDCDSSRHLYQIVVNNRDELLMALNECGIFPGVHYRDNTEYSMYAYGQGKCPKAHQYSEKLLSLPLHMRLAKNDVNYIIECVLKYAK